MASVLSSTSTSIDAMFSNGVDTIYPKKKPSSKKVTTASSKLLAHHIEDMASADMLNQAKNRLNRPLHTVLEGGEVVRWRSGRSG